MFKDFRLVRLWLFALSAVFSIIDLGISINVNFKIGIATSVLTIVAVIPSFFIEKMSLNAFVAYTAVELAWLGILWILWLGSSAYGTSNTGGCSPWHHWYSGVYWSYDPTFCSRLHAMSAFAFLNWLALLTLFIWVLTIGIKAHRAGRTTVWHSPATEFTSSRAEWKEDTPMADKGAVMGTV